MNHIPHHAWDDHCARQERLREWEARYLPLPAPQPLPTDKDALFRMLGEQWFEEPQQDRDGSWRHRFDEIARAYVAALNRRDSAPMEIIT